MKRNWDEDELLEHFGIVPIERKLIGNKTGASRLGFAVLLKYSQREARFPTKKQDIPKVVVDYIASQLGMASDLFEEYRWGAEERNFTYHRKQIREFFGFSEWSAKEIDMFKDWLKEQVQFTHDAEYLKKSSIQSLSQMESRTSSPGSLMRMNEAYPHLQEVLSRPINWDLIRQQYEQIIKYATALRLGTASAEAILKRFTRDTQHPTYRALWGHVTKRKKSYVKQEMKNPDSISQGITVLSCQSLLY